MSALFWRNKSNGVAMVKPSTVGSCINPNAINKLSHKLGTETDAGNNSMGAAQVVICIGNEISKTT